MILFLEDTHQVDHSQDDGPCLQVDAEAAGGHCRQTHGGQVSEEAAQLIMLDL